MAAKASPKKAAGETTATPEEKKKALDTAVSQIEKSYGKGAIIIVGETLHVSHFWLIDNIRRDLGL